MNRFKWLGALAVIAAIALSPQTATAAGTASGTTLTNVATIGASNATDTTTAPSTDTTVNAVYGDTISNPANQNFGPGDTLVFSYQVQNNGNATDSFSIWISDTNLTGGATGDWRLYLSADSTGGGVWDTRVVKNDTLVVSNLAANAVRSFYVMIVSDANAANSPDNSSETYTLRITSRLGPDSTQYVGDNGTTYAVGGARNFDTAIATISRAVFTLTKSIDTVTLAGAISTPRPGASLWYQITYDSVGTATPTFIIVRDSVPANTKFDTASSADTALGSAATFAVSDSSAGWVLQFATVSNPSQVWASADYSTTNPGATNVTWIRWVRTTLPVGDKTRSFWYRVIIQ